LSHGSATIIYQKVRILFKQIPEEKIMLDELNDEDALFVAISFEAMLDAARGSNG
jgi:hypothetical protein